MTQPDDFHRRQMTTAIIAFIKRLEKYPGWREWNRDKIGRHLFFDDPLLPGGQASEFEFDRETEMQHSVIICYLTLQQTAAELRDLEFYFRRFPYSDTPITRSTHLSNCCELYFSKFYQYKERLKKLFDVVKEAVGKHNLAIGKFIRHFEKEFYSEIRERHSIHHHERFEDIEISRVFLIENMIQNDSSMAAKGWADERRRVYRKVTKTWAKRCVKQSSRLDTFTEAVAEALLKVCPFLNSELSKMC